MNNSFRLLRDHSCYAESYTFSPVQKSENKPFSTDPSYTGFTLNSRLQINSSELLINYIDNISKILKILNSLIGFPMPMPFCQQKKKPAATANEKNLDLSKMMTNATRSTDIFLCMRFIFFSSFR